MVSDERNDDDEASDAGHGDRRYEVSRAQVLEWELGRAKKVMRFLGAVASERDGDVDALRTRLYELKRSLGPTEVQRRVAGKARLSNVVSTVAARAAKGTRVQSAIKVRGPSGTAEQFADWFNAESALADSDAMLAACPEHYFIGEDDQGRQKVVETAGGSPLPSEFLIDYKDISSLVTPASPDYPTTRSRSQELLARRRAFLSGEFGTSSETSLRVASSRGTQSSSRSTSAIESCRDTAGISRASSATGSSSSRARRRRQLGVARSVTELANRLITS